MILNEGEWWINKFFFRTVYVILFDVIIGNLLIECQVSKLILVELQNKTTLRENVLVSNYL